MIDNQMIRVAIARSKDGHVTICGPYDFKEGDFLDAQQAATCWSLEAGHVPHDAFWATIVLPPPVEPVEVSATAEIAPVSLPDF